ncbi:DUF4259 domain-containing protein [Altererythrobacter sp. MF3-039]|uniref:DUF4259 domain-containing protein n=1 Tax=Altererythrobacter sp. MF3-039 TaxID=3252901 RepID=UPI00390CB28E
MGAWGAGSFDNDTAMDFVADIEALDDIRGAFRASNEKGHALIVEEIDSDLSCQIIVAAECVAAMRGHRSKDMPRELAKRVHGFGKPSLELYELARNNVSAVMSRSELCDLWAESDSGDWNRAMTELMERLGKPKEKVKKPRKKKATPNPSPCMFCDKPMGDGAFHQLDVTISDDEISSMRMGGWIHLQCLNAALHPKHMIQSWPFDDELLDWIVARSDAEREAREKGD